MRAKEAEVVFTCAIAAPKENATMTVVLKILTNQMTTTFIYREEYFFFQFFTPFKYNNIFFSIFLYLKINRFVLKQSFDLKIGKHLEQPFKCFLVHLAIKIDIKVPLTSSLYSE